jgi:hypothetical protein
MRLTFDSLNYSRTAGMFTVSGKNYLSVVGLLKSEHGVDGIEHDVDNEEYTFSFNKTILDTICIKELYREAKRLTK